MKSIKFGNILTVTDGAIIHGCNAQSVMGSGIAAQIRSKWPQVFSAYQDHLMIHKSKSLGTIAPCMINDKLHIINAITQENFGRDKDKCYVDYEAIQRAFEYALIYCADNGLNLHYPQIGAGLANGSWSLISEIIDAVFDNQNKVHRTLWIYQ